MDNVHNEEIEIDLREILFLLLRRLWMIVIVGVMGGILFGLYTHTFIKPQYESQSMIYILTKSTSITSLTDLQVGTQLTEDYMVFIKSRPVAEKVIENLNLDLSYEEFIDKISIANPENSRVLKLTVTDYEPEMARTIVNELTDVSIKRIAEIMATDEPTVADYGHIPEKPSSPNLVKNVVIGTLLFAFLAIAVIVLMYIMNDSIMTSEDIEKYLGLNTLGSIPMEEGTNKRKTRGSDGDAEKRRKKTTGRKAS